jgi:cytidyltransferase-like protein
MSMTTGFLTGVFDMLHSAHLAYLEAAKSYCDRLIVGLTTDERCATEKRVPFFNYEHRKALLLSTKWVHLVIANDGQTKQTMYKDLAFDVLFTTDEYKHRPEFTSFQADVPHVRLVVFPRFSKTVSTSQLIRGLTDRVLQSCTILAWGITGPIFHQAEQNTVIKMVNVSARERGHTANCFGMPAMGARNWKKKNETHAYPNLCGINAEREVSIHQFLKNCPWYTVTHIQLMSDKPDDYPSTPADPLFHYVVKERMTHPVRVYWIHQRHAGMTLKRWIHDTRDHPQFVSLLSKCVCQVYDICQELEALKVVHGDIHHENVCVYKWGSPQDGKVSLVDWGWCNHPAFDHEADETEWVQHCLKRQFDWTHFIQSLQYAYELEPWFPVFKATIEEDLNPQAMEQDV